MIPGAPYRAIASEPSFDDALAADIERLERVNRTVALLTADCPEFPVLQNKRPAGEAGLLSPYAAAVGRDFAAQAIVPFAA